MIVTVHCSITFDPKMLQTEPVQSGRVLTGKSTRKSLFVPDASINRTLKNLQVLSVRPSQFCSGRQCIIGSSVSELE